jgi:hypothetical protein
MAQCDPTLNIPVNLRRARDQSIVVQRVKSLPRGHEILHSLPLLFRNPRLGLLWWEFPGILQAILRLTGTFLSGTRRISARPNPFVAERNEELVGLQ